MNDAEIKIYEACVVASKLLARSSAASIIVMADEQYERFNENNKVASKDKREFMRDLR